MCTLTKYSYISQRNISRARHYPRINLRSSPEIVSFAYLVNINLLVLIEALLMLLFLQEISMTIHAYTFVLLAGVYK